MTRFIMLTKVLILITGFALAACSNQTVDKSHKLFPDSASAAIQQTDTYIADNARVQKDAQTKAYTQAIAEYIKAIYKKDASSFDTLFFGKHTDFPDIDLPAIIQNTKIVVLTSEEADLKRKYNSSLVYINMFGWITEDKADFFLVTFFPAYLHQYDYFIDFKFNNKRKEFEIEKARFENYIYNKAGKLERIAIYKDGKYVVDKPMKGDN